MNVEQYRYKAVIEVDDEKIRKHSKRMQKWSQQNIKERLFKKIGEQMFEKESEYIKNLEVGCVTRKSIDIYVINAEDFAEIVEKEIKMRADRYEMDEFLERVDNRIPPPFKPSVETKPVLITEGPNEGKDND